MSNVKRWEPYLHCDPRILDGVSGDIEANMAEHQAGDYVLFTDYERLRDALEKISQEWQALNAAIIKYPRFTAVATELAAQEIRDMRDAVRRGREALPPAAGDARENDGTAAARKEKERAGSLEEADAPKAARKDKA